MSKQEIIEHIYSRDFDLAIDGLKRALPNKNDVILVASRWKGLERDITKGLLSQEYADRVKSQIAAALLDLAEKVKDEPVPAPAPVAAGNPAAGNAAGSSSSEPNVFISYNHRDSETANRMREFLESNNVKVTIDAEAMKAGEDIKSFIERCIRDTDVTLSLVSSNSLLSAWVGMESQSTLTGEGIANKRFIPVSIQSDFFKLSFVREATATIDEKLNELKEELMHRIDANMGFEDLQNDRTRYNDLKNNLPKIVQTLKERLTLDISDGNFESNMERVVSAIKG